MWYCTVLYSCTVLYCTVLYCTVNAQNFTLHEEEALDPK